VLKTSLVYGMEPNTKLIIKNTLKAECGLARKIL